MCGIFGSKHFQTFERLYYKNRERGDFAHGFMYQKRNGSMYIRKNKGTTTLTGEYSWDHQSQYDLFLGHTQAPTSAERKYKTSLGHPFDDGNFIVAHNGVLENHMLLAEQHNLSPKTLKVDTQIITRLLNDLYVGSDVLVIQETCNKLKGLFSCWIHCKESKQTYIVRNGSTLYSNHDRTAFSSMVFGDVLHEVPEGVIFCFTTEGMAQVGTFETNSAFFML